MTKIPLPALELILVCAFLRSIHGVAGPVPWTQVWLMQPDGLFATPGNGGTVKGLSANAVELAHAAEGDVVNGTGVFDAQQAGHAPPFLQVPTVSQQNLASQDLTP